MIIEKLAKKYKINCNKGMALLKESGVLKDLNSIIEWDHSSLPEIEGEKKELLPGDCFLFDKDQVIAVNSEDELVLIISATGPKALNRVYDENIKIESKYLTSSFIEKNEMKWEMVNKIPSKCTEFNPPYSEHLIWLNKFVKGRENLPEDFIIKATLTCDMLMFIPVTVYLTKKKISYDTSELDRELKKEILSLIYSWFYNYEERIKVEEPEETNDSNVELA